MNPLGSITTERPREKRYGWFRLFNGFPGHRKWRLIAKQSGLKLAEVEAIVVRLFECANKAKPRGSIADFSVEECAADLDLEAAEVVLVYQKLEARGWIDREYLSTWDKRQPDKEDATAAERQQRRREKIKAERESRVTSVTVTPKTQTTEIDRELLPSVDIPKVEQGQRKGSLTWEERDAWLKEHRTRQRNLPFISAVKQRDIR